MMKLGSKRLAGAAKIGTKAVHMGSKIGSKYIGPAAAIATIAAPEAALGLAVGAEVGKPVLKGLERATR